MKRAFAFGMALTLMASGSAFARSQANHPLDRVTSTQSAGYSQAVAEDGADRRLNSVAEDGADRHLNAVAQDGAERQLNSVS